MKGSGVQAANAECRNSSHPKVTWTLHENDLEFNSKTRAANLLAWQSRLGRLFSLFLASFARCGNSEIATPKANWTSASFFILGSENTFSVKFSIVLILNSEKSSSQVQFS